MAQVAERGAALAHRGTDPSQSDDQERPGRPVGAGAVDPEGSSGGIAQVEVSQIGAAAAAPAKIALCRNRGLHEASSAERVLEVGDLSGGAVSEKRTAEGDRGEADQPERYCGIGGDCAIVR